MLFRAASAAGGLGNIRGCGGSYNNNDVTL